MEEIYIYNFLKYELNLNREHFHILNYFILSDMLDIGSFQCKPDEYASNIIRMKYMENKKLIENKEITSFGKYVVNLAKKYNDENNFSVRKLIDSDRLECFFEIKNRETQIAEEIWKLFHDCSQLEIETVENSWNILGDIDEEEKFFDVIDMTKEIPDNRFQKNYEYKYLESDDNYNDEEDYFYITIQQYLCCGFTDSEIIKTNKTSISLELIKEIIPSSYLEHTETNGKRFIQLNDDGKYLIETVIRNRIDREIF